jgi:hypothetical protein
LEWSDGWMFGRSWDGRALVVMDGPSAVVYIEG